MQLKKMFDIAVQAGIENDPRGKTAVKKILQDAKKKYSALKDAEKEEFDTDKLVNPYSDTKILNGDFDMNIKSILVGIDVEVGEVLLADRMNQKGEKIDLLVSHHPEGRALASISEVMQMQADILSQVGVPINIAESLLYERIQEVERRILPLNHTRSLDACRLIGLPYMCLHTVADNHATTFLQKLMDKTKPETLQDIVSELKKLSEYREAVKLNTGPKIINGEKNRKTGKIFVEMTGGTEGSKGIFERLSSAGVGTVVCMHVSEEHFKNAKKEHINVVVAGHIASDTLGVNLLLDNIERKEKLKIHCCSGFRRISRVK